LHRVHRQEQAPRFIGEGHEVEMPVERLRLLGDRVLDHGHGTDSLPAEQALMERVAPQRLPPEP
jgi:hypothetical protein